MDRNDTVDQLLAAAQAHGSQDDLDHEIQDLQQLLRAAIDCMSEKVFECFMESDPVTAVLEFAEEPVVESDEEEFVDFEDSDDIGDLDDTDLDDEE